MPTSLGRIRRHLDPSGSRSLAAQQGAGQTVPVPIEPPFGGYTPDLPPALCSWGDGQRSVAGLVQTRGTMASPPGLIRFGAATLPLGDATPPATAGTAQPVVALSLHRDIATAPVLLRRYAVTADPTLGHFYGVVGATWTDIPYTGAGAGLTGAATPATTLCDIAFSPLANKLYLTNGLNPVYQHTPGGANYTDFSPAVLNPFTARSACSAFQRLLFINTGEAGTGFPARVRYTTTGAAPSLSGTGAGFLDLDVRGEGVAIRNLGTRVAAYFRHGIVLLRATGSLTPSPIVPEYVSEERGLFGTFAVCEVARGMHFGIFNDGWFFITEDGAMRQAGLHYVGDRAYLKWQDTFYRQLNQEQAYRIQTAYDPRRNQIHVLWPSLGQTNCDERWIYDINTDTVWPCSVAIGCQPNVVSRLAAEDQSETWDSIGTTWETETRLWSELSAVEGAPTIVIGTRDGLVLAEEPTVYAIDGTVPSYEFLSARSDTAFPSVVKDFPRLDLHYEIRVGMNAPAINFIFDVDAGVGEAPRQEVRSEVQLSGTIGARVVQYATSNLCGHTLGWGVSGQAPIMIHRAVGYVAPRSLTQKKAL